MQQPAQNDTTPEPAPLISYVHIPKAGGTTLENLFALNYPKEQRFMAYAHVNGHIAGFPDLSPSEQQRYRVISGHYTMLESLYFLPESTRHITILRHPLDRVISNYFMYLHHENHPMGINIRENNITLAQYADPAYGFEADNVQTKYLAGVLMRKPCTAENLRAAMALLSCKMRFGILERYKESIFLFAKEFGWKNLKYCHAAHNKKRPKRETVDRNTRLALMQHNVYDMELYRLALELFEDRMAELDAHREEFEEYLKVEHVVTEMPARHAWRNDDGTLKTEWE